jgi:uncharacterized protein (DUF1697 family)
MGELRKWLSNAGLDSVRTYIQSGNVILNTDYPPRTLQSLVEETLQAHLHRPCQLIVRSAGEMEAAAVNWPFRADAPASAKHVIFLERPLEAERLDDVPPTHEQFAVRNQEIYLYLPDGIGRSKLAAAVVRRLGGCTATTRNWNTVIRLRDLAREIAGP